MFINNIELPDTVIKTKMTPEEQEVLAIQMAKKLGLKTPAKKGTLKNKKLDLIDVFIDMIQSERYYAITLSKLAKFETLKTETLAVTFNQSGKFVLLYNPKYLEELTLPEAIGGLKHEVQHIFFRHLTRFVTQDRKLHDLYNKCCDAAINQYIDVLPPNGVYPKNLVTAITGLGITEGEWYGFEDNQSADYYIAECLKIKGNSQDQSKQDQQGDGSGEGEGDGEEGEQEDQDSGNSNSKRKSNGKEKSKKGKNKGDQKQNKDQSQNQDQKPEQTDDHSFWNKVYNTETDELEDASKHDLDREFENEVFVRKVIEELESKGIGNLPDYIQKEITRLKEKKRYNWEHQLKVFVNSVLSPYKCMSQKRINKRILHHDDLILPGKKKDYRPKLLLARDTSGSVFRDKIQENFLNEMLRISKFADIIVVDCDTKIHQEYTVEKISDFKSYKGGGGTSFVPVFERAVKLKVDGIIYLTDTEGEFPKKELAKKFSAKTIWVTIDQAHVCVPFGKHVNIQDK